MSNESWNPWREHLDTPPTRAEITEAIRSHSDPKSSLTCVLYILADVGEHAASRGERGESLGLAFASAHVIDIMERLELLSHGQCQELFDAYLDIFNRV